MFLLNILTIIEVMHILGLVLEGHHTPAVEVSQLQAHRLQDQFIGKFIEINGFWYSKDFFPSTLISNFKIYIFLTKGNEGEKERK